MRIQRTWRQLAVLTGVFIFGSAALVISCKSRDGSKIPFSKDTPAIPEIEVKPVDEARVEELKIQFKKTLEKIQSDPSLIRNSFRGSLPTAATSRQKTFIVRLRPGSPFMLSGENPDTPVLAAGGVIKKRLDLISAVTAEFPAAEDENYLLAVQKFLTDSLHVLSVEPDFKVKAIATPNDPRFSELWGINASSSPSYNIKTVNAWNRSTGSPSVVVGVVDTGVDYNHQDLAANIWQNPGESGTDAQGRDKRTNRVDDDGNGFVDDFRGWDFSDGDNDPMDQNNHGTHVAGTIGAVGNNGIGITGVNWNIKIVPLRFLDSAGEGYISDAVAAIQYAVKLGLFATNHSWGGGGFSQSLSDAIKAANEAGQLFVAAAGNESSNNDVTPHYPSNYNHPNIIAVTAIDRDGKLAWFSNYGKTKVHLAAPGVAILSTIRNNGYTSYQGTSMATPHVTGAAALLKASDPSLTAAAIRVRLLSTVTKLSSLTDKTTTAGLLNVEAAIANANDTSPPNPPTGLAVTSRGLSTAKVSWSPSTDTNEGGSVSGYEIRFSSSPITTIANWNAARAITDVTYENTANNVIATINLGAGASGYLAVRSIDAAGNLSVLGSNVQVSLVPFSLVAGYPGDSKEGLPATSWVVENDSLRGNVFSDGVGRYPPNANRHLKLPPIPIYGYDNLIVRFWHRLDIENIFDSGSVTIESNLPNSERIVKTYAYKVGEWTQVELELSPHIWQFQKQPNVQSFTIGFRLASDSSIEADGWFIDDIQVIGQSSVLTVTGVPVNNSSKSTLNVSISQSTEQALIKVDEYAWSLSQESVTDCGAAERRNPISDPISVPISSLGTNILCISAPYKDYSAGLKRFYAWTKITSVPPVAAINGLPTGPSNQSSFVATVSGAGITEYSFTVVADDETLCDSSAFDNWRPVSQSFTVAVSREQKTIVCVKGRDAEGTLQTGYTKVLWTSDFTPPTALLTGNPPVSSVRSTSQITVGGEGVISYKHALGVAECGAYGPLAPISTKISLSLVPNGDGERRLCVKGVDAAGNEQVNPVVLSWVQDSVAQPIGFVGLPSAVSNARSLSVSVVASEPGQYKYYVGGSGCSSTALRAATPRSLTEIISDTLQGDGQYALCAVLIDSAGNEQTPPTTFTWTKDTTPPVAALSNTPPLKTSSMSISVVVGGTGVTSYEYTTTTGSSACDSSSYKRVNSVATPIAETFLNRGVQKLCVRGIDSVGNVQVTPTTFTWEIMTAPIITAGLLRVPISPNSRSSLSIGVTGPSGQNLVSYKYAFAPGLPANCARASSWSTPRRISLPITDNLGKYQGYRTLCVRGIDGNGFEQLMPTAATWFKIDGASYSPSSTLYGAVSITSKTSSSVSFTITRNNTSSQSVTTKICRLSLSSGAIDAASCKSQSLRFNSGVKSIQASQSGLSAGDHVMVVLTPSGRIEPLNFGL